MKACLEEGGEEEGIGTLNGGSMTGKGGELQ